MNHGESITQDSLYVGMGFMVWREACGYLIGPGTGAVTRALQVAGVMFVLAEEVFSNKMFLSCLLAYILLWYYGCLVSKKIL